MSFPVVCILMFGLFIYQPISSAHAQSQVHAKSQPSAHSKTVVGWLEPVSIQFESGALVVQAKIDSGADHSSLHAKNIQGFTKNDQAWLRFTTVQQRMVEAPIFRETKIKTKRGGLQARPVILLNTCLAGLTRSIEVNLIDRSKFSTPMLIGRSALSGFVIDPTKNNPTSQISCQPK